MSVCFIKPAMFVVLGDELLAFKLLEVMHGVAADISHGYAALFHLVLDRLHHVTAPLFGELGYGDEEIEGMV